MNQNENENENDKKISLELPQQSKLPNSNSNRVAFDLENPTLSLPLSLPLEEETPRILMPSTRYQSISLQEMNLATFHPSIPRPVNINSTLLRFSETNEEYEKLKQLALQIFSVWDLLHDGIITADEIQQSGIDPEFAQALTRVLDYNGAGVIIYVDFINCLNILIHGTLNEKIKLLLKFLNKSEENEITSDEMEIFLKFAPHELFEKLGLMDQQQQLQQHQSHSPFQVQEGDVEEQREPGDQQPPQPPQDNIETSNHMKKMLTCHDLINLFEKSDRGEEAINIFCQQIIRILKKPLNRHNNGLFGRRNSSNGVVSCTLYCNEWNLLNSFYKLFHIEKSFIFLILLSCLQILLWLYNFFYYRERSYPLSFSIAKGSGLNLRILSIILFLSMMRTTMGALYSYSTLRNFIPLGFNIQIHSFCGYSLVFHSFIHMIGHIIYHEYFVSGGFTISFQQSSLLRGASWSNKGSGDGITGYILMGTLLLMASTALFRSFSSRAYSIFTLTHFLYTGWLIFLCLHVPHLWLYFVIIGLLFLIERVYDFFHLTIHSTLAYSRPGNNGVTFLSVPRAGRRVYPGSYYRIKVPAISPVEWHPFSLASSISSHHLTFFVASSGDWTRQLYSLVSDITLRDNIIIQIQGPYLAPAYTASKKTTQMNLLIASGIGITPFFSIMATKVSEEQNYESDRQIYASLFQENIDHRGGSFTSIKALRQWGFLQTPIKTVNIERLHVIWTIREVSELLFYLNYVSELVKYQQNFEHPVVYVDVYLTGLGKSTDLRYMMAQTLLILSLSSKTSQYMKIHFGRPDFNEIITTNIPQNVYYCGGNMLKESIKEICLQQNIKFHPEDFDSGGSIMKEMIEKIQNYLSSESKSTKITRARIRRNSLSQVPSGGG